ncbi:R-phenyllactate dehydratase activator [Sporomusa ovata DSM 2662]|uniref:Benzoyl-CoA reductase subunit BadG n=1 Tax=Sporomusa ovata TaxID=2378 RepID=A0A0U1L417_9FIRM|nr:acyl-CoA dehydratase activase [Sporomusa ovata]CQR74410.1 Benzoyl-CoA reductase subunit BadG [Sporomusa ovata]
MEYKIGIDLGSTAIKTVIVKDTELLWKKVVPTAPGQEALALKLIDDGLTDLAIKKKDIGGISVTGYGKNLITQAHTVIDEVSANAWGVYLLSDKKARTVINIGGQDIKIIRISEDGKLSDFKMNDKCAAGTGRFFEMAGRILDTPIYDFATLADNADASINLNSTCAVFAESEIVSLLAKGTKKENIIRGLHESIARRIAGMLGNQEIEDDLYLDGGAANNGGLASAIEDEIFRAVNVLSYPQFTVAYGAACFLM